MTHGHDGRPRRKPRAKRAPRVDTGLRIIFRVTEQERDDLRLRAGDDGISGYIRSRIFGGWTANRATLRSIAELHVVGRSVSQLASSDAADRAAIDRTLADVRAAIEQLGEQLGEQLLRADDDAPGAS